MLSAVPRFAGSREEASARAESRRILEESGFACTEVPFEYSQWPGKWGPPLVAAVELATIIAISRTAMSTGPLPALLLGGGVITALVLVMGDAKRRWTRKFPLMRSSSFNLQATRGTPKTWLVAHLDSKSQSIPMLLRIASSVLMAAVVVLTTILLLGSIFWAPPDRVVWIWMEVAAAIAALPSVFCWVGNRSPGALDNATGVAAVLMAAEALADAQNVGILITSGEELGLAGARDWALDASRDISVINSDTFDDEGGWRCMQTGKRARELTAAVETSSRRLGFNVTIGRMIPGILADSIAFADLGIEAVTLSRGRLSTLARIHTRGDNSAALTGKGVADASRLLSDLARHLT